MQFLFSEGATVHKFHPVTTFALHFYAQINSFSEDSFCNTLSLPDEKDVFIGYWKNLYDRVFLTAGR